MSPKNAGYSGTPLARKLGIGPGSRVHVSGAPIDYPSWLEPLPLGVDFAGKVTELTDIVHVFRDRKAELKAELEVLRAALRSDAAVWVSWPKKGSKRPTDITEDTIRELALSLGFVDVKVCAVSEVWSGLKLVIRKELRGR
jgi:hypothetical protein